jgi:predicted metal-binding protein
MKRTKIGIIICDRWRRCAGGKCLRAMKERTGAFSRYEDEDLELAAYTTCDGCPGGNVEYAPAEMKKNGVEVVHLATGLLVGYPPCPFIDDFVRFIGVKYGMEVVIGTHPIPQHYFDTHRSLATWDSLDWQAKIGLTVTDEATRRAYD